MKGLLTIAAVAVYGLGQGPRGPFAAAAAAAAGDAQQQQQQKNATSPLGFEEFMAAGGFDEEGDWEEEEGSSNNDEHHAKDTPALKFSLQQLRDIAEAAAQKVVSLLFTEGDSSSREETAGGYGYTGRGDSKWSRAANEQGGSVPGLNALSAAAKETLATAVAATQLQADALTSSVTAAKEKAQKEIEKVYEEIQEKMGTVLAAAAETPIGRDIQHVLQLLEKGQRLSPSDPAVKRCAQGLSWAGTLLAVAAATAAGGDTKKGVSDLLPALMSLIPRMDIEISSNTQKQPLRSSKLKRRHYKGRHTNKRLEMLQQMLIDELHQRPDPTAEIFLEELRKEAQHQEEEETVGLTQEPEDSPVYENAWGSLKRREKRQGRTLRRHPHHRQRRVSFNDGEDTSSP